MTSNTIIIAVRWSSINSYTRHLPIPFCVQKVCMLSAGSDYIKRTVWFFYTFARHSIVLLFFFFFFLLGRHSSKKPKAAVVSVFHYHHRLCCGDIKYIHARCRRAIYIQVFAETWAGQMSRLASTRPHYLWAWLLYAFQSVVLEARNRCLGCWKSLDNFSPGLVPCLPLSDDLVSDMQPGLLQVDARIARHTVWSRIGLWQLASDTI